MCLLGLSCSALAVRRVELRWARDGAVWRALLVTMDAEECYSELLYELMYLHGVWEFMLWFFLEPFSVSCIKT